MYHYLEPEKAYRFASWVRDHYPDIQEITYLKLSNGHVEGINLYREFEGTDRKFRVYIHTFSPEVIPLIKKIDINELFEAQRYMPLDLLTHVSVDAMPTPNYKEPRVLDIAIHSKKKQIDVGTAHKYEMFLIYKFYNDKPITFKWEYPFDLLTYAETEFPKFFSIKDAVEEALNTYRNDRDRWYEGYKQAMWHL